LTKIPGQILSTWKSAAEQWIAQEFASDSGTMAILQIEIRDLPLPRT
jgi:hypothetical protein